MKKSCNDCEFYHDEYGGVCFAQKDAPRVESLTIAKSCSDFTYKDAKILLDPISLSKEQVRDIYEFLEGKDNPTGEELYKNICEDISRAITEKLTVEAESMRKDLCCKDCFYFNRFDFCTIRSDMIAKCNRDDPICIGFKFKNDYPIEKLGSLEEMLSESIKDCLNKESMIPRKKTIEERISELETKIQKLEKQINELDGSVKATYM